MVLLSPPSVGGGDEVALSPLSLPLCLFSLLEPLEGLTRGGGGGSSGISPLAVWGGGGHSSAGGAGDLGDPLLSWTVTPGAGNADLPSGR